MKLLHKMQKYPLTFLLPVCVLLFWGALAYEGYTLKLDGTFERKVSRDFQNEQNITDNNIEKNVPVTKPVFPSAEAPKTEIPSEDKPEMPETKKEFTTVAPEYLDGALFIGDSRTAVLYEYANWEKTHFFVEYGLSVWDVMDKELASDPETGEKLTVREALSSQSYDKIYMMLGINELGRGTADSFYAQYARVVEEIRTLQPDALIFVQSILHVTAEKDAKKTYINNSEINARNEKLKSLADDIHIFWLDENEVFDEEGTGALNPDYTWDGVHIQAKYIPIWQEYLLSHGIELAITPED